MDSYDIVIVGAGHGGAQAAISLRQRKFEGTIAMVGEEPELPYERPPLSKEYLSQEKTFERILIRPAAFWKDRQVEIFTNRRVTLVSAGRNTLTCKDGMALQFGKLIWAAGGHPRKLPCSGSDLLGVHSVRSRADVDRMVMECASAKQVCVIGGGYIGLETAAVLIKLGKKVTVLEAQDRVLARVAGLTLSRFYEVEHRAQGVDVRLGASVESIKSMEGRVAGVNLANGEFIPCEMVIVGIGIIPAVEPLLEAGAEGGNGVVVDEFGRTSLPHVFAIGDCALHPNIFADGQLIRLESVQNANDLANTVARFITGDPLPYASVPWFWSNQYDLRLQTVGLSAGHDEAILRGDPLTRSFSIIYLKRGKVIAFDCVNSVKDFVQGKALIESGIIVKPEILADQDVQLKELAATIYARRLNAS